MSLIELFWHLDVTENTRYMLIFVVIVIILGLCVMNGKKKLNKNKKKTKCQKNYYKCMKKNLKNGTNDFCYPCMQNGDASDFFYNPQTNQWVMPDF